MSDVLRMMVKFHPSARIEKYLIRSILVLLAAILMMQAFVWMQHRIPEFYYISTVGLAEGKSGRPFVYRVLVPKTATAIDSLLPSQITAKISRDIFRAYVDYFKLKKKKHVAKIFKRGDKFFRLRLIIGVMMLLQLVGYGVILYLLAKHFFPISPLASWIAPIIGFAMLPLGTWYASAIYDPAVLFFTAACFYTCLRGENRWYLFFFTLACFNKETALYLLLIYILCAEKSSGYIKSILAQSAIFISIFTAIHVYYANNFGHTIEVHLFQYYIKPLADTIPFPRFVMCLAAIFILFYRWNDKPIKLRRTMWMCVFATLVWIVCGLKIELRALYDIHPYIALLLTHSLLFATQIHKARLFRHV